MTVEGRVMHGTEGFSTYANKTVLRVSTNKVEGLVATRICAFQRGAVLIAYTACGVSTLVLHNVVLLNSTRFIIC